MSQKGSLGAEEKALDRVVGERVVAFFKRFPADRLENLYPMFVTRVEKALIEQVLVQTGGSQVKAAKVLGINRNTLRRKVKNLKINGG